MSTLRADLRAACITLLDAYATSASLKLQTYRSRPNGIVTPMAWVDGISETVDYDGLRQRTPVARVIVAHRKAVDSGEAADQSDAFVDGFLDWVTDNIHAAGANTTIGLVATDDIPDYVPDWLSNTEAYYATEITLRGYAG